MPPNRFESEVESFLEGSHGDRTHIKRADHPRLHHYAGRYSARCRFRYKIRPARAIRPRFRYKIRPARSKWPSLTLFLHAGRVLYRFHHQEAKQGELCTERKAEIELADTTALQAPQA